MRPCLYVLLVGRVVDAARARGLLSDADEMVSLVEKVHPHRSISVPCESRYVEYGFDAVESELSGLHNSDTLGSAILETVLNGLYLSPDSFNVSDFGLPLA